VQLNKRHLPLLIGLASAAVFALMLAARVLLPAQPRIVQIPTLAALPTGAPVLAQPSGNAAPAAARIDAAADASVSVVALPPAIQNESAPAAPVAQAAAQLPAAQPASAANAGQPVTIPVDDNAQAPPTPAIQRLDPLFGEIDSAVLGAMDAPDGLGIVRSRAVTLNLPVLEQALSAQSSGGRFMLNLFNDAVYVANAVSSSAHPTASDGYVWQGQISEQDWSQVLFAVGGGQLEGHIWLPNVIYSIRAAGSDVYFIQELDPNAFARPHTPPVPPLPDETAMAAASSLPELAPASAINPVQIDILIAYTDDARVAYGSTAAIQNAIALAVHSTNQAYINSGVYARLRLVAAVEVAYNETGDMSLDLQHITNQDGVLDELLTLRDTVAADVVSLITNPAVPDFCGLAWFMNSFYSTSGNPLQFANLAYSVVYVGCLPGGLTLAHEVGHNMGLDHDRNNSGPDAPILPYAFGYQHPNGFLRDVMAYADGCILPCPAINYFSSGSNRFGQLALGDSTTDGSSALNFTAPYVAQFRGGAPVIVPTATPPPSIIVTPEPDDLYPPPPPCQVNIPDGDITALSNAIQSASGSLTVICLATNGTYFATSALPLISGKGIALVGNGSRLTKDLMSNFRFFSIGSNGQLRMYNLTVENGYAATGSGGAIDLQGNASLIIINSTFRNNRARDYGGAIHSDSISSAYIEGSTFYQNSASLGGALAIRGNSGSAYVQISNFLFNAVDGDIGLGSAVYTNSINASVLENSCFTNNANVSIAAESEILYVRNSWWGRPSGPVTPTSPEPQAGIDTVGNGVTVFFPLTQSPAWCNTTDLTPPVITLNGANPYELLVGTPYVEPGFSAYDAVSGNLTANVNVSGSVNVNVPGSSILTYSVMDGAGNNTSVTRTVNVISSDANLVRNGSFASFSQFYTFQGFLVATIDSGVLNTRRTSPLGTAFIGNLLPAALPANAPLDLNLDLGNSSNEAKQLSVIVRDVATGQQVVCPFVVPPNTPLTRYAMRARTPAAWSQPEFRLSLEDLNVQSLLVDNILLQYKPSLIVSTTECQTPLVADRNYLVDGDFTYWGFNWNFSGFIAAIVNDGVLNTRRTAPFGFGLVNQPVRLSVPMGTPLDFTVAVGNSSNEAKMFSLELKNTAGSEIITCPFIIPGNTTLRDFTLQALIPSQWAGVDTRFFAEDINIPWLLVDDMSLTYQPGLAITGTNCLSGFAPDRNYMLNHEFTYGNLFHSFRGPLTLNFNAGVLQITRSSTVGLAYWEQETRIHATTGERWQFSAQMGNSHTAPKNVLFGLYHADVQRTLWFQCPFVIPAGAPLQTYTLRFNISVDTPNLIPFIQVDDFNQPFLLVDNVDLRAITPNPLAPSFECIPPGGAAPLPPTMPAMPTLEFVTDEPKPSETPTATATVDPALPSPTAEATGTPRGWEAPTPTATPLPSETPIATSTDVMNSVPTATPEPPTPTPTSTDAIGGVSTATPTPTATDTAVGS
jgi:predicted outer membrane repeat protein